jgi:hypothetical protein
VPGKSPVKLKSEILDIFFRGESHVYVQYAICTRKYVPFSKLFNVYCIIAFDDGMNPDENYVFDDGMNPDENSV